MGSKNLTLNGSRIQETPCNPLPAVVVVVVAPASSLAEACFALPKKIVLEKKGATSLSLGSGPCLGVCVFLATGATKRRQTCKGQLLLRASVRTSHSFAAMQVSQAKEFHHAEGRRITRHWNLPLIWQRSSLRQELARRLRSLVAGLLQD